MIPIGTPVRIRYPEYAAGKRGRIQAHEASGRYIVKLEDDPSMDGDSPLILSLDESDFEVLHY